MELKPPTTSKEVMSMLQKIFQAEMSGIIRYLHYSFMIMGPNRIPIQKWFRDKASECSAHSIIIGEKITSYGGHPSVVSDQIEETNEHSVQAILEESLKFEVESLELYKNLVKISKDDVALEELARSMVKEETDHIDEARKMLRK